MVNTVKSPARAAGSQAAAPSLSQRLLAFIRNDRIGRNATLFLMALPGLAFIFVFKYLTLIGIRIAFTDYRHADGILGSEWVGLKNFQFLFGTDKIWEVTRNTVLLNALFIVTGLIASVAIAILVYEVYTSAVTRVYQTTLFFPSFISWIIVAYFVFALLGFEDGLVNKFLTSIGLEPVRWYSSPEKWPWILALVSIWKGAGSGSLLYLATMLGIDPQQFEAARIDGANKWQEIRYVTLPALGPIIVITTLLSISKIFNADFGLFYTVTRDSAALYPTTDVIDTFVYRSLINLGNVSMSMAASLYQAVVNLILVLTANWVVRRWNPERSLF
jgi:putative aldouronate transport system permease protein